MLQQPVLCGLHPANKAVSALQPAHSRPTEAEHPDQAPSDGALHRMHQRAVQRDRAQMRY